MERILIYGAGQGGRHLYEDIEAAEEPYEVLAFVDMYSKEEKIVIGNNMPGGGIRIIHPDQIYSYDYDRVMVAVDDNSVKAMLMQQYNVPEEKINTMKYKAGVANSVRIRALEHFKELCDEFEIQGSTAEVGVYQGDFAKHINRIFPGSELYLYDTFEGFDSKDLAKESEESAMHGYTHYAGTAEGLVMSKMMHKDKVHIFKGLFPETAAGKNDMYAFVNLDADLYAPILAGLEFFWPRMSPGGIIFVHDYFNPGCPGVKQAVAEFKKKTEITVIPLGDYLTVAISKNISNCETR